MRLKMTDLTKCKGNGQPKLKVEADDSCRGKLQNVKSQISGFPQQKLGSLGGLDMVHLAGHDVYFAELDALEAGEVVR